MYDDVLVPTDGSQGATAALEHGMEIASKWGATLHTLYVVDTRLARSGPLLESTSDIFCTVSRFSSASLSP
jgi:nucleotide-binding universal stress UspA family protein